MSSLRASASAARLLRSASHARAAAATTTTTVVPGARRFESSQVPAKTVPEPEKKTTAAAALPTHNAPDYNVTIDLATSTFTPVPKHVQDGSEEGILPAGLLSGAPLEMQARTVRIYKPTKPATQSGTHLSSRWRMDWDVQGKGHRWENPLMGWQSSADAVQGTQMHFKSKEDAVAFAEKQGYEYFVQEPNERRITPKAYANNFLWSPGKLKHIRTK